MDAFVGERLKEFGGFGNGRYTSRHFTQTTRCMARSSDMYTKMNSWPLYCALPENIKNIWPAKEPTSKVTVLIKALIDTISSFPY